MPIPVSPTRIATDESRPDSARTATDPPGGGSWADTPALGSAGTAEAVGDRYTDAKGKVPFFALH